MCHETLVAEFIGSRITTSLSRNRLLTCLVVAATTCVLASGLAIAVSSAQLGILGGIMFLSCLPELPYAVLETWNALVGFYLRRTKDFSLAGLDNAGPFRDRIAIVMTVRNETVAPVFVRFEAIKASVDATGHGAQFDYFLLSDSVQPEICSSLSGEGESTIQAGCICCAALRMRATRTATYKPFVRSGEKTSSICSFSTPTAS
jgi:membrane glycosyltransferase